MEEPRIRFSWWHWVLICCIDIIGPFSTDSYIPNLPEMSRELDAPSWLAGLTLQANWLAKGVGTLAIGPLSDSPRVGRRGALLGAFVFYCAGTVGCSLVARNRGGASALVAFRVVQGLGESATTVCSAVARDVLAVARTAPHRVRVTLERLSEASSISMPRPGSMTDASTAKVKPQ